MSILIVIIISFILWETEQFLTNYVLYSMKS